MPITPPPLFPLQDAILGGDVRLDAATRSLQYHKRVPLGGGAVGVFGGVSLAGALAGDFSAAALKPSLAFRYELGGGGAVCTGQRIDVRHRVALGKGVGLEARGSVRLPSARAQVNLGGGGGEGRVSFGGGNDDQLHLHLEEVNAVLWL